MGSRLVVSSPDGGLGGIKINRVFVDKALDARILDALDGVGRTGAAPAKPRRRCRLFCALSSRLRHEPPLSPYLWTGGADGSTNKSGESKLFSKKCIWGLDEHPNEMLLLTHDQQR
jgi:hypothetical protein